MDRHPTNATEHQQSCASPSSTLYYDVNNVDELRLPLSLQSSLWSFSQPSVSYQQLHRSTWGRPRPGANQDIANCQYVPVHDLSSTDLSYYWLRPFSDSTAFSDDVDGSFRPVHKFDPVRDAVKSSELNSFPTKHAYHHLSSTTDPDDYLAASNTAAPQSQKLGYAQDGMFTNYEGDSAAPTYLRTSACDMHNCDKSDFGISLDELRMVRSECVSTGNVTSCSYSKESFPNVSCSLHSVRCSSLSDGLTEDCIDVSGATAARLHHHHHHHHHHFHPVCQQPVFTNCHHKNEFRSCSNVADSQQSARQSASMNDLDVIDLPFHDSSDVQADVDEKEVSATAESHFMRDTGFATPTKPDHACSHLQHRELGNGDVGFCSQAAAEMMAEKPRSNLNVQNCTEQDISTSLPSFCSPNLPLSSKKSKKKVQRVSDEKLRPVIESRTAVCGEDNIAACNGAIDNNFCTAAAFDITAQENVETHIKDKTGKKHNSQQEKTESESSSKTTHSDRCRADSAENDKLNHSSHPSNFHMDSRLPKSEARQTAPRHRRTVRSKASSRSAAKQKSSARRDNDDTAGSPLKQFLSSVDWQQLQRNFGMFVLLGQ